MSYNYCKNSFDYRLLERVLKTPEVCRPHFESYRLTLLVIYILAGTSYILVTALHVVLILEAERSSLICLGSHRYKRKKQNSHLELSNWKSQSLPLLYIPRMVILECLTSYFLICKNTVLEVFVVPFLNWVVQGTYRLLIICFPRYKSNRGNLLNKKTPNSLTTKQKC